MTKQSINLAPVMNVRASLSSVSADRFASHWRYPGSSHYRRIPKDHPTCGVVAIMNLATRTAGPLFNSRPKSGTDPSTIGFRTYARTAPESF